MNLFDNTYSSLARRVLFPLHERGKAHCTLQIIREMEDDQWRTASELRHIQEQRLRHFLKHAVWAPYYRTILEDTGVTSDRLQSLSDLTRLPFLSKDILRNRLGDLRTTDISKVERFTTGGSTGSPVAFYLGKTRVSSDVAARWRAEAWWGVGVGDREYVFWGSPLELTKQDRMREARDKLLRTKLMSAFEMSPATMDKYLDQMHRTGCTRIFGYPSSIFLLCTHARRRGRDLSTLGVKAVFVTAEYLWDHWRQMISESFGCPVANGYGGRDSGFIAHECPAGAMHVTADRMLVEIIGDGGGPLPAGESGEIVVTHFDTPEMPFIRYRTGDIGALGSNPCSCGRTLPVLERIEGRKTDFIVAPDGRVMHGLSLIYVLRKIAGLEQFRITQHAIDKFEVEVVANGSFNTNGETEIKREFQQRLRALVHVNIRRCESIAPAKSGKFRYVISEVAENRIAADGASRRGTQNSAVAV